MIAHIRSGLVMLVHVRSDNFRLCHVFLRELMLFQVVRIVQVISG
jgi:hypothetical protein